MKTILLIITPGRQSTEALHWCLHKAKELQHNLKVIYAVDNEMTNEIEQSIADTGFIGEKPGEELKTALEKEFYERGKSVLTEIERQGVTFQCPLKTELKTGSYFEICEQEANKEEVDLLVVLEKKVSFLKKIFKGPELDDLRERISCEVKVYQAD